MIDEWLRHCWALSHEPADLYSGARKILRGRTVTFEGPPLDDLELIDAGYTRTKLTLLRKLYFVKESHEAAIGLWEMRRGQAKYGSVGFTTFGHLTKSDPAKRSKRASVMGPCIQAVNLTWVKRSTEIDCFYRTTEFFKKFPADLVFLRDILLAPFNFDGCPITRIRFHFANITLHPMYFVTILPHEDVDEAIEQIEHLRKVDPRFWTWIVKWTGRYLCPEYERGIQKHSQSLRVQKDALERLSKKELEALRKYIRDNHPGFRS